ncbi:hypothetical protein BDP55DRAFT_126836 [Colletotrichum godetiae]|uniref:Uncharacterized protein n=1 Tax=Colletotrichum godetiae TaxID=1209918 RepID=A0AAJ0F4C3_9PEZI|nr:uncharacterized protein BDP55DRAFT_126836 [Colletotrichum godetiae]KAK1700321.1 hypothetical protein BDP55DRAFT_126836 [Colletotrichum godetiae]
MQRRQSQGLTAPRRLTRPLTSVFAHRLPSCPVNPFESGSVLLGPLATSQPVRSGSMTDAKETAAVSIPIPARTTIIPPPGSSSSTRPRWRRRRFFFRSWLPHHANQNTTPGTRNKEGARGTAMHLSSPRAGALSGGPIDDPGLHWIVALPVCTLWSWQCLSKFCLPTYLRTRGYCFTHEHVASALLTSFPEFCLTYRHPVRDLALCGASLLACVAPYIFPLSPVAKHHCVA